MGKVLFLGVEGSGKSCLTAALASYFEAHAENGWSLRPENKEAFAFSTRMPKRLAAGELPAQTARFRHLRWSLCYKDDPQRTLDVLDYPGEVYRLAFLDPEDDPNPETLKARQTAHADEIRELMSFAKDADQIFVLFNLSDAKNLETDDQNIDAVWVTVQTLKILGSLESKPQLTLLITQADRLVKEGENVSDVNVLLKKHAPIIPTHCKGVNAMTISALDAENVQFGLLPMARMLLEKTGLYEIAKPKWDELKLKVESGEMVLQEERNQLIPSCEMFVWVDATAASIASVNGEFAHYFEAVAQMDELCAGNTSNKMKLKALKEINVEGWPKCALACRAKRMLLVQEEMEQDNNMCWLIVLVMMGFIAIIAAIVIASNSNR